MNKIDQAMHRQHVSLKFNRSEPTMKWYTANIKATKSFLIVKIVVALKRKCFLIQMEFMAYHDHVVLVDLHDMWS